ncbi:hypothetical protein [Mammaliicoccus sciuri]|uniref:hypothetical protein n=1 Tax=Mammaliicoccus sciuri TaxID=1296 RepID=UPI002DC00341|nr:hypothetical protein [Mammaliicoccus sciuri]MEB7049781.1 hypothetical protein [Mammaliicoccus sciuri]MEB7408022.1 hypothetical protein [Mammaliicoccus sciuri]
MKYTTLVQDKVAIKINKDGNIVARVLKGGEKVKFKQTDSLVNVSEYDNNYAHLPSKPFSKIDYSKMPSIILDNDTSKVIGKSNTKRITIVENDELYGFGLITPNEDNITMQSLINAIKSNKIESIQLYLTRVSMNSNSTAGGKDANYITSIGSINLISINTK